LAGFAPPAVRLLHLLQPGDRVADHRLRHVVAGRLQADENLPGAVDVVDAPAADPAAAFVLGLGDEVDAAIDLGMPNADAELAESLQNTGCDVGAARVEHGVVVGEGDLGEDLVVDVAIEGSPAAVLVLHLHEPGKAAPDGGDDLELAVVGG